MFENGDEGFAIAALRKEFGDCMRGCAIGAEDEDFGVGVEYGAKQIQISTAEAEGFDVGVGPAETGAG